MKHQVHRCWLFINWRLTWIAFVTFHPACHSEIFSRPTWPCETSSTNLNLSQSSTSPEVLLEVVVRMSGWALPLCKTWSSRSLSECGKFTNWTFSSLSPVRDTKAFTPQEMRRMQSCNPIFSSHRLELLKKRKRWAVSFWWVWKRWESLTQRELHALLSRALSGWGRCQAMKMFLKSAINNEGRLATTNVWCFPLQDR